MPTYTFETPIVREGPAGGHRLFSFYKLNRGITITLTGATYTQRRFLIDSELDDYDAIYRGGYKYTGITSGVRAALIAGGVGVTSANFTEE